VRSVSEERYLSSEERHGTKNRGKGIRTENRENTMRIYRQKGKVIGTLQEKLGARKGPSEGATTEKIATM